MFSSWLIYSYIIMGITIQCFISNVRLLGLAAHISDFTHCNSPRWVKIRLFEFYELKENHTYPISSNYEFDLRRQTLNLKLPFKLLILFWVKVASRLSAFISSNATCIKSQPADRHLTSPVISENTTISVDHMILDR